MTKRGLPALLLSFALFAGLAFTAWHNVAQVLAQSVTPTLRPHQNFVDLSGNPCSGCSLYSYVAGTTTPTATYTDYTGGTPNTNPIILDAAGGANIWLLPSTTNYKFVLCEGGTPPSLPCITYGSVQWTVDQVPASCTSVGCTFTGPVLMGPTTFNVQTYTQFSNALTLCGSSVSCSILITANIAFSANVTVPANVTLIFGGGQLQPATSYTLTMNGNIIDTAAQIFGGAGTVAGLTKVRPEWFGGTNAAAFLLAYNALSTSGGDMLLQLGTYVSPWNQATGTIGTKNNVRFLGSGMGDFNSGATAVVGGTIIQGQFQINASYNQFKDLCIDDGSAVIAALFSNAIGNGLEMANSGSAPYKGIVASNVCALNSSATAAVHDMLFENVDHLFASNLNTLFGTHGVILKGEHSTIIGTHGRGHNSDCVIAKVDTGIAFLDDSIFGVHCESYNALDTGLGGGGIFINGGTGGGLAGLTISGATMRALGGPCIGLGANTGTTIADVEISDVNCDTPGGSPAVGLWLENLGGTIQRTHITNLNVNNTTEGVRLDSNAQNTQIANFDETNGTDGIYNNGGAYTQISGARCSNCSGYTANWVSGFGSQEGVEGYTSGGAFVALPWQAAAGTTVNDIAFGGLTQGRGPLGTSFNGGNFIGTSYASTQGVVISTLSAAGSGGPFSAFVCASATCSPNYGSISGTMGSGSVTTGDFVKIAWTGAAFTHKAMCAINAVDTTSLVTFTGAAADTGNSSTLQVEFYAFTAPTASHTYVVNYLCF